MKKTIFISDLHLEESQPDITALFFKLLTQAACDAEALYILGDFFEVWIGDDNLTPFNQSIIDALKKATQQGLPIYIMHGNRDFLLGKQFLKKTGCKLLSDETVISLYGVPTLLLHGDTLCTDDVAYLKFRKTARHWFFQKLFLLKSLAKRQAIATRYRKASQAHVEMVPEYIMDVTQTEVERVMRVHKVQQLIHGHTHRQAIHLLQVDGKPATRIVLGAWHGGGNALIWQKDGTNEFMHLTVT